MELMISDTLMLESQELEVSLAVTLIGHVRGKNRLKWPRGGNIGSFIRERSHTETNWVYFQS